MSLDFIGKIEGLDPNIDYAAKLQAAGYRSQESVAAASSAERLQGACDLLPGDADLIYCTARNVADGLTELKVEVDQLKRLLEPSVKVCQKVLRYDSDASTTRRGSGRGSKAFKLSLINTYVDKGVAAIPQTLPCHMTGLDLPSPFVIAAHLFKSEWERLEAHVTMLGFDNIDDHRNGLLLFKPIEWAFDRSLLIFVEVGQGAGGFPIFEMRLLQKELAKIKLIDQLVKVDKGLADLTALSTVTAAVGELTFGDFDRKHLQFKTQHRPFKRVLYFHAKVSSATAVEKKWLAEDDTIIKIPPCSSDFDEREMVQDWLDNYIHTPHGTES